ncbi:MAG: CoA transferase [Acidobacteria bacterium]|nr:MAG: CoA transferase [Acidobacteriota bacterium]
MERPDLAEDLRFARNELRLKHTAELLSILQEIFRRRPTEEWLTRLEAEGVPSGPIHTIDQVLADPQIIARRMLIRLTHPSIGELSLLGNPINISGVEKHYQPPPRLGEHTDEVLRNVLGYSEEKITELRESGVV